MDRPNILLLTIDTLRADALSCYGYPKPISPRIDRLADRSLRFSQALTGGSWTQAAFPVMLTSSHASLYGGCLGPLSPARPSPIEMLARHGYETFGYSSSPLLSKAYGYGRGFSEFFDLVPDESDPFLRSVKGGERLLRLPVVHQIARFFKACLRPARLYVSGEEITDRAIGRIGRARAPFFGWLHYMDVHWPYHLEEQLLTPGQIADAWNDIAHLYRVNWKNGTINEAQKAHYLSLYEQAIRHTDGQVGRLFDYLERAGLLENTILVIVSDHGEEFLERGQWGHFEVNLHDEILKIPLIIHLPGMQTGMTIERQVRTLDIMPTLLDLCAVPEPPGMEGRSLVPLWTDGAEQGPAPISISEMWRDHWHIIAVRSEAFKYIWNSRQPDRPELYDLIRDPAENHNVAGAHAEVAANFQKIVDAHLQRGAETAPAAPVTAPGMDEKLIRRLRDLGYVE